jgi:hypothetical protein
MRGEVERSTAERSRKGKGAVKVDAPAAQFIGMVAAASAGVGRGRSSLAPLWRLRTAGTKAGEELLRASRPSPPAAFTD